MVLGRLPLYGELEASPDTGSNFSSMVEITPTMHRDLLIDKDGLLR